MTPIKNGEDSKKGEGTDFRKKYKTEICKYWEVNQECRYKDSVSIFS